MEVDSSVPSCLRCTESLNFPNMWHSGIGGFFFFFPRLLKSKIKCSSAPTPPSSRFYWKLVNKLFTLPPTTDWITVQSSNTSLICTVPPSSLVASCCRKAKKKICRPNEAFCLILQPCRQVRWAILNLFGFDLIPILFVRFLTIPIFTL